MIRLGTNKKLKNMPCLQHLHVFLGRAMLPVVDGPFEIAVDQIVELRGGCIAILLHNFPSRFQNDVFLNVWEWPWFLLYV